MEWDQDTLAKRPSCRQPPAGLSQLAGGAPCHSKASNAQLLLGRSLLLHRTTERKEDSVRTVFVTLLLNLCPGCQTQSISTVQRRRRALEPGSKAGVVAVHPLRKASLHQRPVYQHHLISNHTPQLNQRKASCTVACHLGQQCCIASHLTHGCVCLG